MCQNPIKLANKGYRPHSIYNPPFIEVPCGHCWQCHLTRQNDYAFRVLSDLLSNNCVPFFVTLTYNDYYLPKLEYCLSPDKSVKSVSFSVLPDLDVLSVWNKQHVQRFNKILRRQLSYYYGVCSEAFKYLVTCERGSNDEYIDDRGRKRIATNRPHYHCMYLLFVPPVALPVRKLPNSFYNYCRLNVLNPDFVSFFKFLLNSRWIYGNIDDIMYCRDVVSATKYITKYISKDINEHVFYITPDCIKHLVDRDYNDRFQSAELRYSLGYSYRGSRFPRKIELKDLLPRSFSSINLGMSFVYNKSFEELLSYCSGQRKVCLPSRNSASLIMLPLYYVRKLTRFSKSLRFGSYSQRYKYNGNCFYFKCVHNIRRQPPKHNWNNVQGFFVDYFPKTSFTETCLNDFGKLVQRRRLLGSFHRFKNSVSHYFSNRPYFNSVINSFSNVRPDDILLSFRSVVLSPSLLSSPLLHGFVDYHYSIKKDFVFDNIFNFMKLCHTSEMHLKHLSFEKVYANKLARVAFDNPDLFLNHYL